jgi:hypothetical protein
VLARYELLERLGTGAFGEVWRAHDAHLQREVAIKVIPRERVRGGRLEREARAAARLSHPGIVRLYEAAADAHDAYLVCELVRGPTLAELLAAGLLSDADAARFGVALCDALAHAHRAGVIHRDLKPANVLVPERPASPAEVAKLTDFGVARLFDGETLTRVGEVVGTAAYMAPEQAAGEEVGPEVDVFALAVVLHEAFSGANPLGRGPRRSRREARASLLRRARRDLPAELTEALDAALDKRPEHRPSLVQLRQALADAVPYLEEGLREDLVTRRQAEPSSPELSACHGFIPIEPKGGGRALPEIVGADAARPGPLGAVGEQGPVGPRRRWRVLGRRVPGAVMAAVLAAAVVSLLPRTTAPIIPVAVAAALTFLLPRLGWLVMAGAAGAIAALSGAEGDALLLLTGFALPVLLLPLRPRVWSFPVLAPLLGLIGMAGAWPALAGRARGPFTRAGLGACGWLWLLIAGSLHRGGSLYLPRAAGLIARAHFADSARLALSGVLHPLAASGALLGAPVWALGAVLLPWMVRGRSLMADLPAALLWSAAVVSATAAAVGSLGHFHGFGSSPACVVGAVVGALLAVAPAMRGAWAAGRDPELP